MCASDAAIKNFHLPLPEETDSLLREASRRAQVPATTLAREAIDSWLREQARKAMHDAIASYAKSVAGSRSDLDPALEQAGVRSLLENVRRHE